MSFIYLACERVSGNGHYDVLRDRSGWGLVFHRAKLKIGDGITRRTICVNEGVAPFALFSVRDDLPFGTRMFAPELGVWGSHWVYLGATTRWVVASPFVLVLIDGSLANPGASLSSPNFGFKQFGPPTTVPIGFWTPQRRIEGVGNNIRASGTSGTIRTQLRVGDQVIFDAQWTGGMREQRFDVEFWRSTVLSDPNDPESEQVPGITSTGILAPGATESGSVPATIDCPVTNLLTEAQPITIGMFESQQPPPAGNYGLVDLCLKVVA